MRAARRRAALRRKTLPLLVARVRATHHVNLFPTAHHGAVLADLFNGTADAHLFLAPPTGSEPHIIFLFFCFFFEFPFVSETFSLFLLLLD
jgi:hypothetical protein